MGNYRLNISDFEQDFGSKPKYRLPEEYPQGTNTVKYSGEVQELATEAFDGNVLMSVFGTPILGAVKLDKLMLTQNMFTITGSNHIIETDIAFLDGTVNEYFGQNDYEINLSGYLIGETYQEALQMANKLDRLCKMKSGHEIYNSLLKELQIDRFVIRNWKITPEQGSEHYFTYRIDGKSERPIVLDIKEL